MPHLDMRERGRTGLGPKHWASAYAVETIGLSQRFLALRTFLLLSARFIEGYAA